MKKFCVNLLAFALFALLFYVAALVLLPNRIKKNVSYGSRGVGFMHKRVQQIDSFKNIQVLFIGSSRAYRSFDVRIFKQAGITSFNLGSSSQTPMQTLQLLKKYMPRLQPKLVVFEVNPLVLSMDGVESSLDIIANDPISSETWNMAFAVQDIRTYNTLVYTWARQLMGKKENPDVQRKNDVYVSGGFVEHTANGYFYGVDVNRDLPINPRQLTYLTKVLHYLKQHQTPVLLVQAPVTAQFYKRNQRNTLFEKSISALGLPYYNYNTLLPWNDTTCFMDEHHLNQKGVQLFNSAFLPVVQQYLAAPKH